MDALTILHISDMQFGKHHQFGRFTAAAEGSLDTLLNRLETDLNGLRNDPGLRPDLIAITGDLAEWGLKNELEQAKRFIEGLERVLGLPAARTLIIPGNHDVNRAKCESYFSDSAGDETTPVWPAYKKWEPFAKCFAARFDTQGVFGDAQPYTYVEFPDLCVAVACLNSSMAEGHLDEPASDDTARELEKRGGLYGHFGYCGEKQLTWFAQKLASARERGWLRLALVHHNLDPLSRNDNSALHDRNDFARILGDRVNVVLHGHTHNGAYRKLADDTMETEVPVFSTGSAGLRLNQRPDDAPMQFQLVRIERDSITRYGRLFDLGQKRFVGDNKVHPKGNAWIDTRAAAFHDMDATFPQSPLGHVKQPNPAEPSHHDAPTESPAPAPAVPAPRKSNLPQANALFLDADHYLDKVAAELAQYRRVALSGAGGLGKTEIALAFAHRQLGNGIYQWCFRLNATSPETLAAQFCGIAEQIGLPIRHEKNQDYVRPVVQAWLRDAPEPWLMILDNFDPPGDVPTDETFVPLLPYLVEAARGHVIVTTQLRSMLTLMPVIQVRPMTAANDAEVPGAILLLNCAGLPDPGRALDSLRAVPTALADQARSIVREFDGLPLAIDSAGAYIRMTSIRLDEYLQIYRDRGERERKRRIQTKPLDHPSVYITYQMALERVRARNPAAAELVCLCAVMGPAPLPISVLTAGKSELGEPLVSLVGTPEWLEARSDAAHWSLLAYDPNEETLFLHRLAQASLRDDFTPHDRHRLTSAALGALARSFPEPFYENQFACKTLLPHVLAHEASLSTSTLDSPLTTRLAATVAAYFETTADFNSCRKWLNFAQEILTRIGSHGGDHPDLAAGLNDVGFCLDSLGKSADALPRYQQALEMRKRLFSGDHPDLAMSLNNVAFCLKSLGKPDDALPLDQQALQMRKRLFTGDHRDVAISLNNLAGCIASLGHPINALPLYRQALEMNKRLSPPDHPSVAGALNNMASCLSSLNKSANALRLFEQALQMRKRLFTGDHPDLVNSLTNIAHCLQSLGKLGDALIHAEESVTMIRNLGLGSTPNAARVLRTLAGVRLKSGDIAAAETHARRAFEIFSSELPSHPDTREAKGLLDRIRARRLTLPSPTTLAIRSRSKPGRNQPCHCGSGKKFKYCCGGTK